MGAGVEECAHDGGMGDSGRADADKIDLAQKIAPIGDGFGRHAFAHSATRLRTRIGDGDKLDAVGLRILGGVMAAERAGADDARTQWAACCYPNEESREFPGQSQAHKAMRRAVRATHKMFRLVTAGRPARVPAIKKLPFPNLTEDTMQNQKSREIRLKSRPTGMPSPANFELAETAVPTPGPGQVLVRNSYMSVDPYMRGRMMDRKSYVPPFQIGETLQGGAVGQVVASNSPHMKVGDYVQSMNGWREWFVAEAAL